jgi:hypothetical protein
MGEEWDNKEIVLCPICPACMTVIFQPNIGAGFAIVLDDIIGSLKMLRETCVAHIAPERLGPCPLRAKSVPFLIVVPTVTRVVCVVLEACPLISPVSLTTRWRLRASAWAARSETGRGPCGQR